MWRLSACPIWLAALVIIAGMIETSIVKAGHRIDADSIQKCHTHNTSGQGYNKA